VTTASSAGPLAGVRVLEMGSFIAGPFAGQLLGDYGADVIKVEPPGDGDPMRRWGITIDGDSLWWPQIARNKRSIALDLRRDDARALAIRLAQRCDVVLENFRPGTLARWGLDYATLLAANPSLVLVHVSGFGQTGPLAGQAGFGSVGEAMGGIRHTTGSPDRPPSRAGISLGDALASAFGVIGTLAAVVSARATGHGQEVDVAIYEAVAALMESTMVDFELGGVVRGRSGSVLPGVAPSNVYATADGAEVVVAANADAVFGRLCAAMGQPALATDERYATHGARGANMAELDGIIAAWTAGFDADELLQALHDNGVPAGRIYRAKDMFADPHFAARQAIVRLPHPDFGELAMQNVFPKLSASPGAVRAVGPALGADNDGIYRGLLGLGDDELDRLSKAGVI